VVVLPLLRPLRLLRLVVLIAAMQRAVGNVIRGTVTGRIVAVLLMVGGIGLVGSITATLASWIVQRVAAEDTAEEVATRAQIEELREEIRRLSNLLTDDQRPAYGEGREAI
jgi:voltage-gated potassium channel